MTKRLLVADDSVTIQRVVALTLAGEDVQIDTAADGEKALALATGGKYDMVLADVTMPGLSGYDVCARIKQNPDLSQVPVVLMVGTFESFDKAEASRVGSDGHLTKPFDTSELIKTFRSLVNKAKPDAAAGAADAGRRVNAGHQRSPIAGELLVSTRTRDSFLGEDPVLDIIPREMREPEGKSPSRTMFPETAQQNAIRGVIEEVVRQISPEIVREVAWEVVPEMSEMMIRKSLAETKADDK